MGDLGYCFLVFWLVWVFMSEVHFLKFSMSVVLVCADCCLAGLVLCLGALSAWIWCLNGTGCRFHLVLGPHLICWESLFLVALIWEPRVRGMSTEYPHGGGRYPGQWGEVSSVYMSRVSSVSSPFVRGTPHTPKSTKKCL